MKWVRLSDNASFVCNNDSRVDLELKLISDMMSGSTDAHAHALIVQFFCSLFPYSQRIVPFLTSVCSKLSLT